MPRKQITAGYIARRMISTAFWVAAGFILGEWLQHPHMMDAAAQTLGLQ